MHIILGYVHIISIVIAYELAGRYFIKGIVTFFSYGNEIRVISKFEEHLEWFQYVFQNWMRIFFWDIGENRENPGIQLIIM